MADDDKVFHEGVTRLSADLKAVRSALATMSGDLPARKRVIGVLNAARALSGSRPNHKGMALDVFERVEKDAESCVEWLEKCLESKNWELGAEPASRGSTLRAKAGRSAILRADRAVGSLLEIRKTLRTLHLTYKSKRFVVLIPTGAGQPIIHKTPIVPPAKRDMYEAGLNELRSAGLGLIQTMLTQLYAIFDQLTGALEARVRHELGEGTQTQEVASKLEKAIETDMEADAAADDRKLNRRAEAWKQFVDVLEAL